MRPLTDTRAICGRKLPEPASCWLPAITRAMTKTASTTAARRQAVSRRLRRRRSITVSASITVSSLQKIDSLKRRKSGGGWRRSLFLGLRRIFDLGSLALCFALALRLLGNLVAILFLRFAQGSAENVAKRSSGIGRAILGDGLFLLGDFERLDRHPDLARLGIDLGHHGIELLADAEAVRPLLGTVAREVGAADEAGQVVVDELDLEPAVLHRDDFAGHPHAFLELGGRRAGGKRIGRELLDAEADALLLGVGFEHHGFDVIPLVVVLEGVLPGLGPVQIR